MSVAHPSCPFRQPSAAARGRRLTERRRCDVRLVAVGRPRRALSEADCGQGNVHEVELLGQRLDDRTESVEAVVEERLPEARAEQLESALAQVRYGRDLGQLEAGTRSAFDVAQQPVSSTTTSHLTRTPTSIIDLPDPISYWGTWLLVPLLVLGAIMNVASSSPYERFGWGPLSAVMALLALVIALS